MSRPGTADTDLLLVHADELDPVLAEPVPPAESERTPEGGYEDPLHLWDESRDANELEAQRWGVVVPEGPRGNALLGRVERLIAHRGAQQGEAPVVVYRVPPGQSAAQASLWRKRVFAAPGVKRRDLPRYLLILGDLHEVSAELQVILGSDGYVGRLAFDRDEDYEAYVDKLLRWEAGPAAVDRARAVFHTVHDRTSATTVGHRSLMKPGLALAREYREQGEFLASDLVEVDHGYTPKAGPLLLEADRDEPGLLFTISHGAGAPRRGWKSVEHQRREQGGMSFGRSGGLLTGDALRDKAFMPGGVWFMLACFGAGTPATSKYEPWLRNLSQAGHFQGDVEAVGASLPADGKPFIAGLPKSVLASANGPLAFIGHVDLAWTYSFRELDTDQPLERPDRFIDVFSDLLRRDRAGVAFRELFRHYGQTNTELTALEESGVTDAFRRGHLWMLRNDLAGYMLLGDPAARLPLAPSVATTAPQPSPDRSPSASQASPPPAADPRPAALEAGVDSEVLERAIGLYLAGDMGAPRIIRELGLGMSRSAFEDLVGRYAAAGRAATGLDLD